MVLQTKVCRFTPEFDYRSVQYLSDNDGSTTLGFGFYTIASKEEAENYSKVRQGSRKAIPFVIPILPYQARILDLRRENDLLQNAPFPKELAVKWRERFQRYLRKRQPRGDNIGKILDSSDDEYENYLDEVLELENIDLRVLLETGPSQEARSRNLPSPPWTLLFSDFMLEEGIDGVVYNESSELVEGSVESTYVFYNLKKIGTYESWHRK